MQTGEAAQRTKRKRVPRQSEVQEQHTTIRLSNETEGFRGSRIIAKVLIENTGDKPISVAKLSALFPPEVQLIESREYGNLAAKRNDLGKELSEILAAYLTAEACEKLGRSGFWYSRQFRFEVQQREIRELRLSIDSADEAEILYERFLARSESGKPVPHEQINRIEAFKAKKEQLRLAENELGFDERKSPVLATIPAKGSFEEYYILDFPKADNISQEYKVSVLATIREGTDSEYQTAAVETVSIPPSTSKLSTWAFFSAFLGVFLRYAPFMKIDLDASFSAELAFKYLVELVSAGVLSFIIFNVYEFTEFFRNLRKSLSWRHALYIGVACGLTYDRFFGAFQVLLGGGVGKP
ncbi:MAG: hypothetical protein AAF802_01770 [Planctomycetota bacterium]